MKVAITGKGGVGKTTLSSTLARLYADEGRTVLAADVDPDANLGLALGLSEEEVNAIVPVSKMKQLAKERTGANDQNSFYKLNPDVSDLPDKLAKDIHDACEVEDKHAFDCPVTGGDAGAQAGTLTLIVGAKESYTAPVLPILQTFSDKIYYMGGAGKGQTAKLCNQVSLAACMVGYADAMALAEQGGLDVGQVLDMVSHGMGGSVAMERLAPKSLEGDYKPGFLVEHLRKDLGLALAQAEDTDITLPGAETAYTLYDMLYQIGGARLGTQALSLLYQDEATCTAAGLDWTKLDVEDLSGDEKDESGHCCGGHGHGDGGHCCHHHGDEE